MELNKIFLSGLTFLWVCSGNGYSADRQDGKFRTQVVSGNNCRDKA